MPKLSGLPSCISYAAGSGAAAVRAAAYCSMSRLSRQPRDGDGDGLADGALDLQEAIAGAEASYGPDSRNIVSFLGNAAAHYRNAGDLQRSLEYSERLAAIIESDPNPPAWRGAVALAEYGKTLHALGEAQSTQVLGRARSVLANTLGTSDPRVREIDTLLDR